MRTRSTCRATRMGVASVITFALIAAACGGSDESSGATTAPTDAPPTSEAASGSGTDGSGTDAPAATDAPTVSEGQIDSGAVEDDGDPVAGGTLRFGLEADVDGLNPTSSSLSAPGIMMANTVFDTLTAWNTDGEAVPYLAESVEPVGDDLSKWQVKLRPGITFTDGTPLDSAAIQYNFESQRADPLVGLAVKPYYPEEGATEIIDDLTVQFNLLEPNAVFPGALASQLGLVASPTWLKAALDDPTLNQKPVGTGPFVFDSRNADSVTRFVHNDNWWNGDVYLDAVEFQPVTDSDTRVDLLQNGDLEGLHTSNPSSVGDLKDDDAVQNILDETGEETFAMINSEAAPFDDVRVRQALTFATPRRQYIDLITLGLARPADQRFIPESKYYDPDVLQEGDEPDKAAPLIADYCAEHGSEPNPVLGTTNCTDGKINMEYQWSGPSVVNTQIADLFNQAWSAAGFNVTFDELPQDDHIQQTALGQYNVNLWRQFGATDPALDNVWLMCRNIGVISLNWPRYCDEQRDADLLAAQATTDDSVRIPLYQKVSQNMHDAYTYIFLNHTPWDNAFAEPVRGVCDRTSPEGVDLACVSNGVNWYSSVWIKG